MKEWFIKRMAIDLVVSEKIINSVITHQFDSANDALNIHKSVEISGFGIFYFNNNRAAKQLEKWNKIKESYEKLLADDSITEEKRRNTEVRLTNLLVSIKILKPKVTNESIADI